MSVHEMMEYTFKSKYAGYNEKNKRRETWGEAVDRFCDMFLKKYENIPEVHKYIARVRKSIKQKTVLGSQRGLQFGGDAVLRKNARLYNCVYSHVNRPRFFQEAMYLLLCGCGVGYSVQEHHINKLPELIRITENVEYNKTFVIPDSIEGWADAIGILINSYFPTNESVFPDYSGRYVEFDYSLISPLGTPLSSCRGKAPGPEPLKNAIEKIRAILDYASGRQLETLEVHDIICHFSDAVISGGVRRSALIALFSKTDKLMRNCKIGNWRETNLQRGRANNSVVLLRNDTTFEEFEEIIKSTREFGEPGFYWTDDLEFGANPCVTSDTTITTDTGLYSVESLINTPFNALVNGKTFSSTHKGFWKTGNKEVFELTFCSGRKLKVTDNHKILTNKGWIEAGKLLIDDEVIIHNHRENNISVNIESEDYAKGYLLGSFLGDGNVSENRAELKWWGNNKDKYRTDAYYLIKQAKLDTNHQTEESDNKSFYSVIGSTKLLKFAKEKGCLESEKCLSKKCIDGTWSYLSGLVAGYFDADGTVVFNPKKGSSIRITSSQLSNLENIQIILNSFGIYSTIYNDRRDSGYRLMPDGRGGMKEYYCESTHELCISCDNMHRFHKYIKIRNNEKRNIIQQIIDSYKRTPNKTIFSDKLISRKYIGCYDVYDATINNVHAFDANGIYVHNCVEISFKPYLLRGDELIPGWQGCNLSTINASKIKTLKDYFRAARDAAIIGTLQAGFTNFSYLGEVSEEIFKREALLGVSMTGIMEAPDICLDESNQRAAAEIVKRTNRKIAKLIGINPSARTTCVKPEGTASCVLGTSSGVHPHHSKRYIRRIQSNKNESLYKYFKSINPQACEESVWSANDSDDVISFCIEVPVGAKTKNQISAIDFLKVVKSTQQNWVTHGRNIELCVDPRLNHNVSNTVTVKDEEWDEVTKYIFDNKEYFCGISLLSEYGDKDYPQAPFSTVLLPHEQVTLYGDAALFTSGLIEKGKELWEDNLWKACDALLGLTKDCKGASKQSWIAKAKKYADRYLGGNIKQLTYCLKDVDTYKNYIDLKREYKRVDYNEFIEEEDVTNIIEESACSGGHCELR